MAYTQDERMCQVSRPLGDNVLLLAELNAHESISQPFFFDLQLLSEKDDVDFGALIGKPLSVHLTLANGNERYFHGIVSRFSQGASVSDFTSYRAEVVPFLWLLRRRAGCRIFQHKSAPDIIKAILAETGFSDYEFQLSGEHPRARVLRAVPRERPRLHLAPLGGRRHLVLLQAHREGAHAGVLRLAERERAVPGPDELRLCAARATRPGPERASQLAHGAGVRGRQGTP